jgi:hypothetical protein
MRKHLRYLSYVIRHKWFVFIAGLRVGAPLWRLIIHDWSKFLPCEWSAYAEYFYGEKPRLQKQEADDYRYWTLVQPYIDAFNAAWLHHQHHNPHHWQYWVLRMDSGEVLVLNMPEKFIREMVADWMGAGRAITGKWEAKEWYLKNREKMQLTAHTRDRVEVLLGIYTAVEAGPAK